MNVVFDVNFWNLAMFLVALVSLLTARSRATSEDIDKRISTVKTEIGELRERHSAAISRQSERIQAVETELKNSIDDDDMVAVHRRIDKLQDDMHASLERLNQSNNKIGATIARVEGMLQVWSGKPHRTIEDPS